MLKAVQACDKEGVCLASYYALDLGNIPPASMEQMDMSVIMGQLSTMQREMGGLSRAVQSLQEEKARPTSSPSWAEVASLTPSSPPPPAPTPTSPVVQKGQGATVASTVGQQHLQHQQQQFSHPLRVALPPQHVNQQGVQQVQPLHQPQQTSQQHRASKFTQAYKTTRNGRKRKEVKGTGPSNSLKGVAAPPRQAVLFVGRLDTSTSCEAVALHVDGILGQEGGTTAVEIPHCAAKYGYKGYKVTIPAEAISAVMQADKWPAHVAVKRFYQPKVGQAAMQHSLSRSASAGELSAV